MNEPNAADVDSHSQVPPCIEVAVTLVRRGPLLLAGYNRNWQSYSLPMTKRRAAMQEPLIPSRQTADYPPITCSGDQNVEANAGQCGPQSVADNFEPWEVAAARNVSEWLPVVQPPRLEHLLQIQSYRQSDRDLVVKDYHFEVFVTRVDEAQSLRQDVVAAWLAPADFGQLYRRPISPTARFLIRTLEQAGKLP